MTREERVFDIYVKLCISQYNEVDANFEHSYFAHMAEKMVQVFELVHGDIMTVEEYYQKEEKERELMQKSILTMFNDLLGGDKKGK